MKKTGIFKAMKLCMDYKKMNSPQREKLRSGRLNAVVNHARNNSPYYNQLYKDVPHNFSLSDLPVTDKKSLMENWDNWVCDRGLKLADVERFMEDTSNIGSFYNKEYMVFTTSGSTGNPLVAVVDKNANNTFAIISSRCFGVSFSISSSFWGGIRRNFSISDRVCNLLINMTKDISSALSKSSSLL